MAKRTEITLIDDVDGNVAAETVTFALDGVSYEIDLSEENATKLRSAVGEWSTKARRGGHAQRSDRRRTSKTDSSLAGRKGHLSAVRAWAKSNGHQVSERGRVSREIQRAYNSAHAS